MLTPKTCKQFRKDVEKAKKQKQPVEELHKVMELLCKEKPLDVKHRDHSLKGEWTGRRECHLTSDWLLIYRIAKEENAIYFERLGSHSELFS